MDHNELEQRRRCFGLNDLHIAILSNDMATFRRILKCNNKEALQSRDQDGSTALMIAVLCGRLKFVCFLLRQHASTRARDRQGRKALDYSRMSPFIEKKLRIYKALGFHISGVTFREKRRISEILRYPAALWSWYVLSLSIHSSVPDIDTSLVVTSVTIRFLEVLSLSVDVSLRS